MILARSTRARCSPPASAEREQTRRQRRSRRKTRGTPERPPIFTHTSLSEVDFGGLRLAGRTPSTSVLLDLVRVLLVEDVELDAPVLRAPRVRAVVLDRPLHAVAVSLEA